MIIERWMVVDELNGVQIFNSEEDAVKESDRIKNEHPSIDVAVYDVSSKLTSRELINAHREMEILTIMDDVINRWENYSPEHDHEVRACAEDVYDEMMNDEYVMETYDNALYEHLDKEMENRGLI